MGDELTDFRDFLAGYLDRQYPNDDLSESSTYTKLRDFWTAHSIANSVGNRDAWDPLAGFAANQGLIIKLYDYYRDLFNSNESAFLWAGLGRMAGGAVLGGMRFLIQNTSDPSFITNTMVLIGKQIFLDLAWQHELFRENSQQAIAAAKRHDARFPARSSYATGMDRNRFWRQGSGCKRKSKVAVERAVYHHSTVVRRHQGGALSGCRFLAHAGLHREHPPLSPRFRDGNADRRCHHCRRSVGVDHATRRDVG